MVMGLLRKDYYFAISRETDPRSIAQLPFGPARRKQKSSEFTRGNSQLVPKIFNTLHSLRDHP
jgi:hypothetical protein